MKEKVLEGSWIIDAPLEDVYKIISDFEKSPGYFPLVAKGMKVVSKDGNNLKIEAVTNNKKIRFEPSKLLYMWRSIFNKISTIMML